MADSGTNRSVFRLLVCLVMLFVLVHGAFAVTAQEDIADSPVITIENAQFLEELRHIGYGSRDVVVQSPDGTTEAVGGPLGVWLYDRSQPDADPRLLPNSPPGVRYLAYSLYGALLAIADAERMLVVDVQTGDLHFEIEVEIIGNPGLVFGQNEGDFLVAQAQDNVVIWDVTTWVVRRELPRHRTIALSEDGLYLATPTTGYGVIVYNLHTGEPTTFELTDFCDRAFWGPPRGTQAVGFLDQDGQTVLATLHEECDYVDWSLRMRLWNLDTGDYSGPMVVGGGVVWELEQISDEALALQSQVSWTHTTIAQLLSQPDVPSPDYRALHRIDPGELALWDRLIMRQPFTSQIGDHDLIRDVLMSNPDGTLFAAWGGGGIAVWDVSQVDTLEAPRRLVTITRPEPERETGVRLLGFDDQDRLLLFEEMETLDGPIEGRIWCWDAATEYNSVTIPLGQLTQVQTLALSGNILWDWVVSADGNLLATREYVSAQKLYSGEIVNAYVVVQVWDIESGEVVTMLEQEPGKPINALMFSPDASRLLLLVGDYDRYGSVSLDSGVLQALDVQTGEFLGVLGDTDTQLTTFALSPDHSLLVGRAIGEDVFQVWDAARGDYLASLDATGQPLFSPDGRRLYFLDTGVIYIWGVPTKS